MNNLVEHLYERFFLRDLLSKIFPGLFLLIVITYRWPSVKHLPYIPKNSPLLLATFVLLLSYFLGLASQKLGEGLGILQSPYFLFIIADEESKKRIGWRNHIKRRVVFDINLYNRIKPNSFSQRERLIYLKDGAGSASIALLIAGLFVSTQDTSRFLFFLAGILLVWIHHSLKREQAHYEIGILSKLGLICKRDHMSDIPYDK